MKLLQLIADSGGTKTDWYGLNNEKKQLFFTTESYHPSTIDEDFIKRQQIFWKNYDVSDCQLKFYGSGCLKDDKKQLLKSILEKLGFPSPSVESDLFAAYKALKTTPEMIAICGTGSVLFKVENEQITELRGGLGWDKGDEGSGSYFGKLLIERLGDNKSACPEIFEQINQWRPFEELIEMQNSIESKSIYSQLSYVLKDKTESPFLIEIHRKNINLFFDLYCNNINSISIVGSYAFYLKSYFEEACKLRNIELLEVVERPIIEIYKDFINS